MFLRLNDPYPATICPLTIPNQSDVSAGGVARPLGLFQCVEGYSYFGQLFMAILCTLVLAIPSFHRT